MHNVTLSWTDLQAAAPQLTYLQIPGNGLFGDFHPQLTNLVYLDAGFNNFTGPINSDISNMPNLKYLGLQYNQVAGSLPDSISKLPLHSLDLAGTNVSGQVPNLSGLSLDYCNLGNACTNDQSLIPSSCHGVSTCGAAIVAIGIALVAVGVGMLVLKKRKGGFVERPWTLQRDDEEERQPITMVEKTNYMSGRGKGGKGLGKTGAKRHRKLLRDNIQGVTKPAIRRLCRRGGVKRISGLIYEETRGVMKNFMDNLIKDTIIYTEHAKRKTVCTTDVLYALKRQGKPLYVLLLLIFILLCGELKIFRKTLVAKAHYYLTTLLPLQLAGLTKLLIGKRGYEYLLKINNHIMNEKHPLVQLFYLFLVIGGLIIFLVTALPHLPNENVPTYHLYNIPVIVVLTFMRFEEANVANESFKWDDLNYAIKRKKVDKISRKVLRFNQNYKVGDVFSDSETEDELVELRVPLRNIYDQGVDITQVQGALFTLFLDKDALPQKKKEANKWLESFQKTPAAWQISDLMLKNQDSSMDQRVFACQTLRQKIEYDIQELNESQKRDSLVEALVIFNQKNIRTHLCIALADLAIQFPQWQNPVADMISKFSQPEGIIILLQFLSILPEELSFNSKINLESHEYLERKQRLLEANSTKVLEILSTFYGTVSNSESKEEVLGCITSWIRSGCIPVPLIQSCHLVGLAFNSLRDPEAFDVAVDLACELVIISAKAPRDMRFLQQIYPFLVDLVPFLQQNTEDPDIVRGICRILVEAGEGYSDLIAADITAFKGILEGILLCTSNEDLDIVQITINVWYVIAVHLIDSEKPELKQAFHPIYHSLVEIIIKQMRYPADPSSWTSQERDEFRDFRHAIGDVLKDCVRILGQEAALSVPYGLLKNSFASGVNSIAWQEVEAPLFSLRTMCREVSHDESKYIPEIMSFLPQLPQHPKIKYAAILVIGRYAQWTNNHPEMIQYQLDFVSQGFQHLINYLTPLHTFYTQTLPTVHENDQREMTEGVSHLLSAIPKESLGQALEMFCTSSATTLNELVFSNAASEVNTIKKIKSNIDQLGTIFQYIELEYLPSEPHPSVQFLQRMWPIFEQLFNAFGHRSIIAEAISSKLVRIFGNEGEYREQICKLLQEVTAIVFEIVRQPSNTVEEMDLSISLLTLVVEEYFYLLTQFLDTCPALLISSGYLPATIECALYCLTFENSDTITSVLRYFMELLEVSKPGKSSLDLLVVTQCLQVLEQNGKPLVQCLFRGLVYTFSKDRAIISDVAEIISLMAASLSSENVLQMINSAIEAFPVNEMSLELKGQFMVKIKGIIESGQTVKLRSALTDFAASYARRNLLNR
ncbi:Nuclear import receptor [Boothiomyces sp. JEL0838]|nr:Nuclear import receptor [Boothiomyces sp. JEL0838]